MNNLNRNFIFAVVALLLAQVCPSLAMDLDVLEKKQKKQEELNRKRKLEGDREEQRKKKQKEKEEEHELLQEESYPVYTMSPFILSFSGTLRNFDEVDREAKGIVKETAYPRLWNEITRQRGSEDLFKQADGFLKMLCRDNVSEEQKKAILINYGSQKVADTLVVVDLMRQKGNLSAKKVLDEFLPLLKQIVPSLESPLPVEKIGSGDKSILPLFNSIIMLCMNGDRTKLRAILSNQTLPVEAAVRILKIADYLDITPFARLFDMIIPELNAYILNSKNGESLKVIFQKINAKEKPLTYDDLYDLFECIKKSLQKVSCEFGMDRINRAIALRLIDCNVRPDLLMVVKTINCFHARVNKNNGNGNDNSDSESDDENSDLEMIETIVSPDGTCVASCLNDQTIKVLDVKTGKCRHILAGHGDMVWDLAFSPDGKYIVSGSGDGTVKLWDVQYGWCMQTLTGHDSGVSSVLYTNNGTIISMSYDKTIIWNEHNGKPMHTMHGEDWGHDSVTITPDGRRLISADISIDNFNAATITLRVWDVQSGKCILTSKDPMHTSEFIPNEQSAQFVKSIVCSPDGKYAVSIITDGTITNWDLQTGKRVHTMNEGRVVRTRGPALLAYSPCGRYFVSGSDGGNINLWDARSGILHGVLKGHESNINSVTFSPDGKHIISVARRDIKVWDFQTGRCINTFDVEASSGDQVVFSSDGKRFVYGNTWDGKIRIWTFLMNVLKSDPRLM